MLIRELNIKVPVADPVQCIARISNNLGVSEKTKRLAIKILRKAEEVKISAGKDPMSLAGGIVYLACMQTGEPHSQRDIARTANATEVTIRSRSKELKDLKLLL